MARTWRNWSGGQRCTPRDIHSPATLEALQSVVARAADADRSVRVAGAGHSFSPVVPTDDVLVSLERFTGVVDVDRDRQRATVRAGTPLWALNESLAVSGLAMENLGDVDRQSVAGAMTTGTHGTGQELGVLATQLAGITLVTADGELLELSPEDGDTFRAAQVSLGALGVIAEVTLDLEPAYTLRQRRYTMPLEACLEQFDELRESHRHFEFFWFPHTADALVKVIDRVDADEAGGSSPLDAVGERLANGAWEGLCRLGAAVPRTARYGAKLASATLDEGTDVGPSHEIFANDRSVRFNEMEYGVPIEEGPAAMREIREVADADPTVQFPIEFRVVAGDDIPLSPAHGRDTAFIAVHKYHRKPYRDYFDACEDVFKTFEGRPHWGKLHWRDADELAECYPQWDVFQTERRELDPDGVFLNDHLRTIFGVTDD